MCFPCPHHQIMFYLYSHLRCHLSWKENIYLTYNVPHIFYFFLFFNSLAFWLQFQFAVIINCIVSVKQKEHLLTLVIQAKNRILKVYVGKRQTKLTPCNSHAKHWKTNAKTKWNNNSYGYWCNRLQLFAMHGMYTLWIYTQIAIVHSYRSNIDSIFQVFQPREKRISQVFRKQIFPTIFFSCWIPCSCWILPEIFFFYQLACFSYIFVVVNYIVFKGMHRILCVFSLYFCCYFLFLRSVLCHPKSTKSSNSYWKEDANSIYKLENQLLCWLFIVIVLI